MIVGIGTDLCSVPRMRRAVANGRFVEKVFSREEIRYATSRGDPALHFASAFAAKEALAKASGLGMFGLGFTGAWVRRTDRGPVIEMDGEIAAKLSGGDGSVKCWLSLSHDGDYALAFVVLEVAR
jgi:holo-[acyl-carrier protein] synthase